MAWRVYTCVPFYEYNGILCCEFYSNLVTEVIFLKNALGQLNLNIHIYFIKQNLRKLFNKKSILNCQGKKIAKKTNTYCKFLNVQTKSGKNRGKNCLPNDTALKFYEKNILPRILTPKN